MILVYRIADDVVMNDRQSSDFGKKSQLTALQEELANMPGNTHPDVLQRMQGTISELQTQLSAWELRRREIVAAQFGGTASDYAIVDVPQIEQTHVFSARDIIYDGQDLTYDVRPLYEVIGNTILVTQGWASGNYRLLADDLTDFSSLVLTEPMFFQLIMAQEQATKAISVQLLTRDEDEEFAELPPNLTEVTAICEGRINLDNSITMGGF